MASVVGVHGIAQEFKGPFSLEQVWFAGARDGLAASGHEGRARMLREEDLKVAFFGDLFRKPGSMGPGYPYSPSDLRRGLEVDLLAEFYQAAAAEDTAQGSQAGMAGNMRVGRVPVQVMVERLLRTKAFAGIAQRAFVGALKQVADFLSVEATKDRVLERMRDAVGDDTRVIIGHSMGSVVAYEYLCRYEPSGVRALVTLGSPLGIRNLIFDRLTPAPVDGRGVWPGKAQSWVNVADRNDVVALRKEISGLWEDPARGRLVVDRRADNGDEPHSAERYLSSRQTGAALANALGESGSSYKHDLE